MQDFLESCFSVVAERSLLFVVLNWLFFGAMVVGALLGQAGIVGVYERPMGEEVFTVEMSNALLLVVSIFFFNLFLSGFLLVTLTGLVFFVLPLAFLLYRALLWGGLLNGLPMPLFLIALPTLVLEGEGYVLAGVAGVKLGLSWLMPKWTFGEDDLSRVESFKKASKDTARVYVFVVMFLLVAAIVETATLFLTQTL